MAGDSGKIHLPTGPANLCFNKDNFMKELFSVDQFICECRKQVPLETLRDDLHVYLRILQSAMVELINKDYADFVNLSTNLVGLDKVISNIVLPIGQLKEEILIVKSALEETMQSTKQKLAQRQQIREKKACLQHLMNISQCIGKIEQLLCIQQESNDVVSCSRELTGDLIERVATEFNQLHFYVTKSKGHIFIDKIKPRILNITRVLQNSLEESFLIGLAEENVEQLSRCLRIYATIDRMKEVEDLFRMHIVKPFLNEIVQDKAVKSSPDGLKDMYDNVLAFIPLQCNLLKNATKGSSNSEPILGYDFVVNSVWPELTTSIETRLTFIFAPANPDVFHKRYTTSMKFLEEFETLCGSQVSVKRLREHPSYISFSSKWNLPVYFQIRFQDIAGMLEYALLSPWEQAQSELDGFTLQFSYVLWKCLNTTWSEDVYVPQLCHRFWKLTLQLIARYSEWVQRVSLAELETQSLKEESVDPAVVPIAADNPTTKPPVNGIETKPALSMSLLTLLVVDVQLIISKLPVFCTDVVLDKLTNTGFDNVSMLQESIQEAQTSLNNQLPQFRNYVVEEVSGQCAVHLKLVNDIPRLYRRTNREVPTKPSLYVSSVLQPLDAYLTEHKLLLSEDVQKEWSLLILSNVTQQYYNATSNVLTSVRKMEESLTRLKKARERGNSALSGSSLGMTDDDKIRLQLVLDVETYGKQIESVGCDKTQVEHYGSLVELVESARNSPSRTS